MVERFGLGFGLGGLDLTETVRSMSDESLLEVAGDGIGSEVPPLGEMIPRNKFRFDHTIIFITSIIKR